jgi:signal transduction histidine kinase
MHEDAPDSRLPGVCQFSLDAATAEMLVRALLSAQAERTALLHALIVSNGSFASWCRATLRRESAHDQHLPTTEGLAAWISSRLPELLGAIDRIFQQSPEETAWHSVLSLTLEQARRLQELETRFDDRLQRAKLDSLKELAYGASHEINNPLANISMRAQSLIPGEIDPERRRKLAQIHVQAMRAHEMIADLMLFARPPKPVLAIIDARDVAREQFDNLRSRAIEQATELQLDAVEYPCSVQADATQIGVALRALIINALEALGSGGNIGVQVDRTNDRLPLAATGPIIRLTVTDDGPGVPEAIRPHLFDPFFSGREAGRGLGFGLTKAWRIVTDHGGDLSHHPANGGGTTFVIALPAAVEGPQA